MICLTRTPLAVYLTLLVLIACPLGCGSGGVMATGNVTVAGQPIEKGSISFKPADSKGPSLAGRIENGQYTVHSTAANAAGKKIVHIAGIRSTGRKIPAGPPEPPGTMVEEILPFQYGVKGELTCELVIGETNHYDFNVTLP